MSSLLEILGSQLGGNVSDSISRQIGADQQQTRTAIAAAIPSLMEALSRQTQQPGGAEGLHRAIEQDHDGSLLDNLNDYVSGGAVSQSRAASGGPILDHVLGPKRSNLENGISRVSGLDAASAAKLLAMLAPLVMGALGKQQRSAGLNPGQLSDYLQKERTNFEQGNPQQATIFGKLLDQDGDGDFDAKDMMKLGAAMIGRMFSAK